MLVEGFELGELWDDYGIVGDIVVRVFLSHISFDYDNTTGAHCHPLARARSAAVTFLKGMPCQVKAEFRFCFGRDVLGNRGS